MPLFAVALPLGAAAQQALDLCVVEDRSLHRVRATVDPASGDTLVEGRPMRTAHPTTAPAYALATSWFRLSDTLTFEHRIYVKVGAPRALHPDGLVDAGTYRSTPVFRERAAGDLSVLYVPLRPGCEFQAYRLRRDRGPDAGARPPPRPPPPPPMVAAPNPQEPAPPEVEPPPGEVPPTQPTPGPFSATDSALTSLAIGTVAFNTPERLALHETRSIQLLLSPTETGQALEIRIGEPGSVESHRIRIGDRMAARLVPSPGLLVQGITPEVQPVSSGEPTEWIWNVTAVEDGEQRLVLTLDVLIPEGPERLSRSLRTFRRSIEVEVTMRERITTFVTANWQWLWAALAVPIGGMLLQWFRRRNDAPEPD